jgi:N-acetylmuramoyl-L-alanine amidase
VTGGAEPRNATLLLRLGDAGAAVRDLQQRLQSIGYRIPAGTRGTYDEATADAVRVFQTDRRIRVDGICGPETWGRLVEAGFQLGDRTLYQTSPMQRGDDVLTLQHRLNKLGIDAGREDGIFGPDTEHALVEFQAGVGLIADGISGPETIRALARVDALAAGSVAELREREALRHSSPGLRGRSVFIASDSGFSTLAELVADRLAHRGAATLLDVSGATERMLASLANHSAAELFLLIRFGSAPGFHCAYYQSPNFRSEAGYRYATAIHGSVSTCAATGTNAGMMYPALRETRMAAVVCEPTAEADQAGYLDLRSRVGAIAEAIASAIEGVAAGSEPDANDR